MRVTESKDGEEPSCSAGLVRDQAELWEAVRAADEVMGLEAALKQLSVAAKK